MQIPDFKKAVDSDSPTAAPQVLKPLPALVAVQLNHSRFGLNLYRYSYSVFALSLLLVFYPFILAQPLWLLALVICWCGLWWVYRQQSNRNMTGLLEFCDNHWQWEQDGRTCQLELTGAVVCWSWLIVLPLREIAATPSLTPSPFLTTKASGADHNTGKVRQLVIFSDALTSADNARLRRWLRACLVPSA